MSDAHELDHSASEPLSLTAELLSDMSASRRDPRRCE